MFGMNWDQLQAINFDWADSNFELSMKGVIEGYIDLSKKANDCLLSFLQYMVLVPKFIMIVYSYACNVKYCTCLGLFQFSLLKEYNIPVLVV